MNEIERISRLLEAGFTADEVRAFYLNQDKKTEPDEDPEEGKAAEAAGANPSEAGEGESGAPDPSPDNFLKETRAQLTSIKEEINKEIAELKKAYERFNINQLNNQEETSLGAKDAFAQLTNPPGLFKTEGDE